MKKLLVFALSILCSAAMSAQNDDWQTGGGYNGSNYGTNGSGNHGSVTYNRENNHASFTYPESTTTTLFNGGHNDAPFGLQVGYVNKDWVTDFGNYTWHENLWGQKNKRVHGFQLGFVYQPCFNYGLGLHTGVLYEGYSSYCDGVKDQGWDKFYEHNIYFPVHGMYRFPFSENISLMLYGGVGFNWAIYGEYREYGHTYYDSYYGTTQYDGPIEYQQYGSNSWPHHWNIQGEVGASLRFGMFQCSFTWSRGLTNHEFYKGYKTRQDKLAFTIALVIGNNDL